MVRNIVRMQVSVFDEVHFGSQAAGDLYLRSHVARLDPEIGGDIAALEAFSRDMRMEQIALKEELSTAPATREPTTASGH